MKRETIITLLAKELKSIPKAYYSKYSTDDLVALIERISELFQGEKELPYLVIENGENYLFVHKKYGDSSLVFPSRLGFVNGFYHYLLQGYNPTPIREDLYTRIHEIIEAEGNKDPLIPEAPIQSKEKEELIDLLSNFKFKTDVNKAVNYPRSLEMIFLIGEIGKYDFSYYTRAREQDYISEIEESPEYQSLLIDYIERNYSYFEI